MKNSTRDRGQFVAAYINGAEEPARLQFEEFVREIQEVTEQIEFAPDDDHWETTGEGQILRVPDSQLVRRLRSLERKMNSRYPPSFRLIIPSKGDARLRLPVLGDTTEAEAAIQLKTLAEEGWPALSLLRKCEGCSKPNKAKWIFASRPDQKCCNRNCRQKKLEATSDFQKSRSLYMKIQYWDERERDLRHKIDNLPKTREGQKAKAQLEEKRRAARAKFKAANSERERLKSKEEAK